MFDNAEIAAEELPQADSVTWLPMDKRFLRRLLTQSTIAFALISFGVGALQITFGIAFRGAPMPFNFGWLWLVPMLLALPLFGWPLLAVPRMAYAVRERDILYKSGVFWRTVTVIPFNRIQHVEKSSTPLDRRFDIATLQIFTAGGMGGDLKIHGLAAATAERLRSFIIDKVGSSIERH